MTSIAQLIELPEFADSRGSLVVAEHLKQLPFSVERVFFQSQVPAGDKRGMHAHRACHQVLVCVSGAVTAVVGIAIANEQIAAWHLVKHVGKV